MLDRINNNRLDEINQGESLNKILSVGATNPFEKNEYKNLLIDESDISNLALEKYQRELDVKKFSDILKETDENEANELVVKNILNGNFSFEDIDIFDVLSNNNNLINDLFKEN